MQATSDANSTQPNSGTPTLPRGSCRRLMDVDSSPGLVSKSGILPYKTHKKNMHSCTMHA